MSLPEPVDDAQDGVTLNRLERVALFKTDLQLVSLADPVRNKSANGKLRRTESVINGTSHRRFMTGVGRLGNLPFRHTQRKIQIDPVRQCTDLPFGNILV